MSVSSPNSHVFTANHLKNQLIKLKQEIQANEKSVNSNMGGGANGHLGLVMDDATYQTIPGYAQYACPTHLGPLNIPAGSTKYKIYRIKENHDEQIRIFGRLSMWNAQSFNILSRR